MNTPSRTSKREKAFLDVLKDVQEIAKKRKSLGKDSSFDKEEDHENLDNLLLQAILVLTSGTNWENLGERLISSYESVDKWYA